MMAGNLEIAGRGDCEVLILRSFDAPAQLVYDANTKPELLKRWCYGPDGWWMASCEVDLRVGGTFRYVWRHERRGIDMALGGIFTELDPPHKIVHRELFDEDWTGGETIVTTTFHERNGKTDLEMVIRYSSMEARDNVLRTGMAEGMEAGYARMDDILQEA